MQFYIHPKRKKTLIQRKDGRTYTKNWVYYRTLLRTENDEKAWNSTKGTIKSNSSEINSLTANSSIKNSTKLSNVLALNYRYFVKCLHMLNFQKIK